MRSLILSAGLLPLALPAAAIGQVSTPAADTVLSAGQVELLTLEGKFAQDVAKGGGAAFSSWFADDAVTLNNGRAAVLGKARIAANAHWSAQEYQLNWFPEGARMGPSSDMGFTWGHYDATSKDAAGHATTMSGRYFTVWKKEGGKWKVALDGSANEPAAATATPKPVN